MRPFQPTNAEHVCERYKNELELLDATLEVANRFCEKLEGIELGGLSRVRFFPMFQYAKAFKTTQGIRLLFTHGYDEDAQVLLRVLVEQAIVTRWVHHEDADERVRAYALYLGERQYKLWQEALSVMPDLELPAQLVQEIQQGHTQYLQLPRDEKWLPLTRNIAPLAATVGMRASYLVHLVGSDFVHSNPTREGNYVQATDAGIFFNSTCALPKDALTLIMAAEHFLFLLDVVNDVFELQAASDLQELIAKIRASRPSDN